MNKYNVYVDFTMSYVIEVEAENVKDASKIARDKINEEPYYYARRGTWVGTEVVDVEEEKEVGYDN